jgi:iron(III) transport system substrate-binding protein
MQKVFLFLILAIVVSCQDHARNGSANKLWVYTSLYKDTINELKPELEKEFPGVEFKFFQAGSEEIATKVNAEMMSGNVQADVMISSDRFWYEELEMAGKLYQYSSILAKDIPASLKSSRSYYSTLSLPVMVLCYNSDIVKEDMLPKSFKDLELDKYKNLFTTGDPLSSGTNFTTMAMLQFHYGWDYFKKLKNNNTIGQGGNSSVLRRIQNGERPIGWVLLENVLRFQDKDKRLKIIYPKDGVVTNNNVIAISKETSNPDLAKKFVDFMYGKVGQNQMIKSYMYSPLPGYAPPRGAPKFSFVLKNSFPWTREFLTQVRDSRMELKEKYTEIMFQ